MEYKENTIMTERSRLDNDKQVESEYLSEDHSIPFSQTKKVLVVDDEEVMGYLIMRVVRYFGFQVDWVTSCENALYKIGREKYDIIISDFRLPRMNGDSFYEEIANFSQDLLKRLIFITGDTVTTKTKQFLESIQVPYLSKPFDIEKLREIMEQVLLQS